MTAASVPPPAPQRDWTASRLLALAGGALILIWITKRSFGLALVPLLGILIAVRVQSSRGKRLSMFASWLTASAAAAVAISILLGVGFSKLPPGFLSRTMDSAMVAQRNAPPAKLPGVLEKLQRDDSLSRAARARAQDMIRNPKFLGAAMLVGMIMSVSVLGIIVGTLSWTAALLLARGFLGAWPFRKEPELAV